MKKLLLLTFLLCAGVLGLSAQQTKGIQSKGDWHTASFWVDNNPGPVNGKNNIKITISSSDTILLGSNLGAFDNGFELTISNKSYLKISGNLLVDNNLKINVHNGATFIIEGNLEMKRNAVVTINGAMQVDDIVGEGGNLIKGSGTLHVLGEVSGTTINNEVTQTDEPINDPMPVELLSFTALQSGEEVVLKWVTASEVNNMGFEVQRLNEVFGQWEVIGFVEGHYNHNGILNYSFQDINPHQGTNYYRLRQVDFDGESKIYGPRVVVFDQMGHNELSFKVFRNYGNLQVMVPGSISCSLEVFDMNGNRIHVASGKNSFDVPMTGKPVIIRISNENGQRAAQTVL